MNTVKSLLCLVWKSDRNNITTKRINLNQTTQHYLQTSKQKPIWSLTSDVPNIRKRNQLSSVSTTLHVDQECKVEQMSHNEHPNQTHIEKWHSTQQSNNVEMKSCWHTKRFRVGSLETDNVFVLKIKKNQINLLKASKTCSKQWYAIFMLMLSCELL